MEIKNGNGDWYCDEIYRKSFDSESEKDFDLLPIYIDRNYELFSILANVRNNGEIIPISEPRGFPKNASNEIEMDNASFTDAPLAEVARIMTDYLGRIGLESDPFEVNNRPKLRDYNGNTVGQTTVTDNWLTT